MDLGGELEERVLAEQLAVAAKAGLPAIVHTPRQGKKKAVERILALLAGSKLEPEKVLLDHLNEEVLPKVLDTQCYLGLAVHPAKLSPNQAAEIVAGHGAGRFVFSTDMGSNPSYLFGIPAAISAMQDRGIGEEIVRAVVFDNAARFLGAGS